MSEHIFNRNLLALSARHPEIGTMLSAAQPDPRLEIAAARNGLPVPALRDGGRLIPFHSLVDPEREAERVLQAQGEGGFAVALGLGGGYAVKARLASPHTSAVLVIEYSASLLRALLENLDLSELLIDDRLTLLLDPDAACLEGMLLSKYVPPLSGDLRTMPLRARTDLDPLPFSRAAETVRSLLERISDDYSVQAFFGKVWFRNAIRNLFIAEKPSPPLAPVRKAIICGAGPSLEDGIPLIRDSQKKGAFVIATDTSLPALLGNGIIPGAVISIDCQVISYFHFIKGIPPEVPLVLDLASPNRLARLSPSVRFFSSGHPLCTFLSSRFRPFPALDTSGGNVSHAAISLAESLGAESALLIGADFSYPEGKSYARGTYIYDYYGIRSDRLASLESLFSGFIFRNSSVIREKTEDGSGKSYYRYVTKPLMAYHGHLERFAERSPLAIEPFRGKGVEIRVPSGKSARERSSALFAAGRARESAAAFLSRYAAELAALPQPRKPFSSYLSGLDPAQRDLWTTLLPSASAFQRSLGRQSPVSEAARADILSVTREWAVAEIREALAL